MLKIVKHLRTVSLADLRREWCDHSDNATIKRLEFAAACFDVKETFCLTCGKTLRLEFKKAIRK